MPQVGHSFGSELPSRQCKKRNSFEYVHIYSCAHFCGHGKARSWACVHACMCPMGCGQQNSKMAPWSPPTGVASCLSPSLESGLLKANEMAKMMGIPPMIPWCYLRPSPSRDASAGLEEWNRPAVRGPWRGRLWGNSWHVLVPERGPQLTARKETGTSVLQTRGYEFCQQPHGLGKGP